MSTTLVLNGKSTTLDADPNMPLLWAIREVAGLHGTKFGCGMAQCGACTVHLEGQPIRSCITPLSAVEGRHVTTIEGLQGKPAKAVQAAWVKLQVPQCGYCQSGQIMSAAALLAQNPKPTDADIDAAMSGNICRCATYTRIRAAIHDAAGAVRNQVASDESEAPILAERVGAHGTTASAEALTLVDRSVVHGTRVSAEALTLVDRG
ncbi:Isoquinoline 1-oxidoreductase subunit alpha (modular protein) [Paraburkholderia piptadeniae]|uniref:Isoquinoline 1-oxidoreductase subunit alpha (Modular protein) n=1 Tax=Paraburkholderia piptadeniae TaxID=1701573 RepID=A0A1N7SAG6_9BURK|nr:Isoquinoline 1-oxidoreductase subunit alpha (modular protein) [Paraburkholderia piptadeniae]